MPLVLLRSRLQDFIINFLKNIFTSVLAPQTAIASLGGPGMIRKENNCNKMKVKVYFLFVSFRVIRWHFSPFKGEWLEIWTSFRFYFDENGQKFSLEMVNPLKF